MLVCLCAWWYTCGHVNACWSRIIAYMFCSGHSLGGALGTLAAYDIAKAHPELHWQQISVYTFGAPRAGNTVFAHEYEKTVRDTWHVINDQVSSLVNR